MPKIAPCVGQRQSDKTPRSSFASSKGRMPLHYFQTYPNLQEKLHWCEHHERKPLPVPTCRLDACDQSSCHARLQEEVWQGREPAMTREPQIPWHIPNSHQSAQAAGAVSVCSENVGCTHSRSTFRGRTVQLRLKIAHACGIRQEIPYSSLVALWSAPLVHPSSLIPTCHPSYSAPV